ncbi:hypothetical protein FHS04_002559 [Mesoflavibacter sabulilitoris]|uniref:DUF2809 domain-containing protein n=1 Tax=Mesoflavibacter zeaxanthinifaciens subsp. sabulilitoris TaxID=1520893 RepID=A0A2T1NBP2_9FLAO|nr:DUF2809 domain-containing protein [Mesoflavibacter zeaxanthinifaciens]MBB3125027.1 hypothetical protein [Mesoflavibacter zeaxanthinifaciens subsp. sabulilitoris]PSG89851.1 DUF2809 domain-containing protein [Mesoflavibacter zeaxanthinifaciens subsp. sabulilitoris]
MKINKIYLIIFICILGIEISIALFLKSGFIRHTFGDFLAAILVFSFFKTFSRMSYLKIAITTLIIAFCIEFAQYFQLLNYLNLNQFKLLRIVFGTSFSVQDLVAYTLGVITIYFIDLKLLNNE